MALATLGNGRYQSSVANNRVCCSHEKAAESRLWAIKFEVCATSGDVLDQSHDHHLSSLGLVLAAIVLLLVEMAGAGPVSWKKK